VLLSDSDLEFREALRTWLDDNEPVLRHPGERLNRAQALARNREVQAAMAADGWVGIHWPEEYGGRNATLTQQLIYHGELARRGIPRAIGHRGLSVTGPTLIAHGTDDQKGRFLERIRRADDLWCTGFSEPGAGSDLASLQTQGVVHDDGIAVTGRKIWTSDADFADLMYALVRTERLSDRHDGITCVLIPMDTPGISVSPIRQMTGRSGFCEVILDEVFVPLGNVVGKINAGWSVARTSLSHEHYTNFLPAQIRYGRAVQDLIAQVRTESDAAGQPRAGDAWVQAQIARRWAAGQLILANGMRNIAHVLRDGQPGPEGSIMKLYGQEAEKLLYETALAVLGVNSTLPRESVAAIEGGRWSFAYLNTRASTIGGGTSEIQRNVIAERVLKLPCDTVSQGAAD
jgi:alkylation response protein AidB-like acyl-CoA dehydrogenase